MPLLSGTVIANKDSAPQGYQPLLLATLQFVDGSYARFSTHPLNASEGGYQFQSHDWMARVDKQDIGALQSRSESGLDRIPSFTLHLMNSDQFLWTSYEQAPAPGFKGAILEVRIVLFDIDPSDGSYVFSSDAPMKFRGICDAPIMEHGGQLLTVAATSAHNTAKVFLPAVRCQPRCPWIFPANAAQRLDGATNPASQHWECGFNPDQAGTDPEIGGSCERGNTTTPNPGYVAGDSVNGLVDTTGMYRMCRYTKEDCDARGMYRKDSSNRLTGRFGGAQWFPPSDKRSYQSKSYTQGKNLTVSESFNTSIYNESYPQLYGCQWVEPLIVNVLGDGNSTRMECVLTLGDIGQDGVIEVVVNGVIVPPNLYPASFPGDPLFRWNFGGDPLGVHTGSRNGSPTHDALYCDNYKDSAAVPSSDPFGSLARIEIVVWNDLAQSGSIPSVRVLCKGPAIWHYALIDTAVGDGSKVVVTLPAGIADYEIAGSPPYTVQITGNSWSAVNLNWQLTDAACGPPGTITLASSALSGSGTGGWIRYRALHDLQPGDSPWHVGGSLHQRVPSRDPAWNLLDVLTWSNFHFEEASIDSFYEASQHSKGGVTYTDLTGNAAAAHNRFESEYVLRQRKTAAEVLQSACNAFNAQLVYNNETGLVQLFLRRTLADQQPAAISGSNFNDPIVSMLANGTVANGYVAYLIDESVIEQDGQGIPQIRIYTQPTASTANRITFPFQDKDNSYADDSLSIVDAPDVARAGGYLGGQEVADNFQVLGISNFDQAIRVSNQRLAENLHGNEGTDSRATRFFEIPTNHRIEHLKGGDIVLLRYQAMALSPYTQLVSGGNPIDGILARVIQISPETDYERCTLTLQWHEDVWYTDAYGQQPARFWQDPGRRTTHRLPYPWHPGAEQPILNDSIFSRTDYGFSIGQQYTTDAGGFPLAQVTLSGRQPVNDFSTATVPPLTKIQGVTASTGGTIDGGQEYLIGIAAKDADGRITQLSHLIHCNVPLNTLTNTIGTGPLFWGDGGSGYLVFAGTDEQHLGYQGDEGDYGSAPASITLTSLKTLWWGPPDAQFSNLIFRTKLVQHAGVFGIALSDVTANTFHVAGIGWDTPQWIGYDCSILGQLNSADPLPIADFRVTGNTSDTLTVTPDPLALGFKAGDVLVMRAKPDTWSANTIGDSNFINSIDYYDPPVPIVLASIGLPIIIVTATPNIYKTGDEVQISGVLGTTAANGLHVITVLNNRMFTLDGVWGNSIYLGGGRAVMITHGMRVGDEAGRIVRIYAGTGKGQWRRIQSNTATVLTIEGTWDTIPDASSRFIVEDADWLDKGVSSSTALNSDYTAALSSTVNVTNWQQRTILVRAFAESPGGLESIEAFSPYREIYVYGAQGTRLLITSDYQLPTDGTILCDASGVTQPAADALSGDIDNAVTLIAVASGLTSVTGTVVQIDTERMRITDGGGTAAWTVERGVNGTTAASHTSTTAITLPGALIVWLLPISRVPNQLFAITKVDTSINYVDLEADPTDTFQDLTLTHILPDNSKELGVWYAKAPQG